MSGPRTTGPPIGHHSPQTDNFNQFTVTFDEDYILTAADSDGSGGFVPRIIHTFANGFYPKDVGQYSPDQYTKLVYYMQLYQHFRLKRIRAKWNPIYADLNCYNAGVIANQAQLEYFIFKNDATNADYQVETIFARQNTLGGSGCITFLADAEDLVMRASFDEYYQVRKHPQAVSFDFHKQFEYSIVPQVLDVLLDSYQAVPQDDQRNQPTTQMNVFGSTNSALLGAETPMPMPWIATRVATANAAGTIKLNMSQQLNGLKMYFYTPFNQTTTGPYMITFGHISWTYDYEFKDLETRAILGAITLNEEEEKQMKELALLRKLRGEKVLKQSHRRKLELTPMGQTSATILASMGESQQGQKRQRPTVEEVLETQKHKEAATPAAQPNPQSNASQSTLSVPTRHTLPARLGLNRT